MSHALVAAALATVAGVVVFLATGGNGGPLGGVLPGGPDNTVPEFSFKVAKPVPVATVAGAQPKSYLLAAKTAAVAANKVMHTLFTEAFLDPANWRDGSYDTVWKQFSASAAIRAQGRAAVLTAGEGAGGTFDAIEPSRGSLKTRVLLDAKGSPVSIMAVVHFSARGVGKDGTATLLQSAGSFFLKKFGGAWKVVSFEVKRTDTEEPAPAPSGAGSPTGAGSPS